MPRRQDVGRAMTASIFRRLSWTAGTGILRLPSTVRQACGRQLPTIRLCYTPLNTKERLALRSRSKIAGVRWMPQLVFEGWRFISQLRIGPLHPMMSVGGAPLGTQEIIEPDCSFLRLFDIPECLIGRDQLVIAVAVDRVAGEPGA